MFNTYAGDEVILGPAHSSYHGGIHNCPAGEWLAPGGSVEWSSNGNVQGTGGIYGDYGPGTGDYGCDDADCGGLPLSMHGLGGGWQICFV